MDSLISRQAAIDAFTNATSDGDKVEFCWSVIRSVPPAQPEIIRCKNCKHYEDNSFCGNEESTFVDVEPDSFCSWAERREDD